MSQQQGFGSSGIPGAANIEFIEGNDSVAVPPDPATHILTLLGNTVQGVSVTNTAPNTETVTVASATTTQIGVTSLATNAETIAGTVTTKAVTPDDLKAKLGTQTLNGLAYGGGTTAAVNWLADATNGQIPIGSTGAAPVLANITSADGSVIITNGAGTIDLSSGIKSGTVTTVDATPGVLNINIPVPASSIVSLRVNIAGYDTANNVGCAVEILGGMKNVAGTLTVVGNTDVTKNCDTALVNITGALVSSGTNCQIQLTGVVGHTINWRGIIEVVTAP
jgi:hypothetical protein